jgi:hypothetical protein
MRVLWFVMDHQKLFKPETDNCGKFLTLAFIYNCNINSGDKLIERASIVESLDPKGLSTFS